MNHFFSRMTGLLLMLMLLAAPTLCESLEPLPIDDSPSPVAKAENYLPDAAGYEDESLSVKIETTRLYDTNIMIARVKVAHPSQIRTAMTARYGTKTTTHPHKLAKRVNAIFAINGDFFNYHSQGYLVRQGQLYRDRTNATYDVLIIDDKGDFHILVDPTEEATHGFEGTIINSFNFGPALVVNGEIVETTKVINVGLQKATQRMAIGQVGPLEYICVATEGPENEGSVGLTIPQIAQLMKDLGATQAYNLDGGSSSAMVLGGEKINALSSRKLRPICDILYFATLVR